MAQLLLQGTNFVNFVGMHAWVGLDGGFEAVRVTEWDEPQAVIGSYLQRFAYPDYYRMHVDRNRRELVNWTRGRPSTATLAARPARSSSSTISSRARRTGRLPAESRRIYVRRAGPRRLPRLRHRLDRQ